MTPDDLAAFVAAAAAADPGERDEPPIHALNGHELDHYAGGKPAECPECRVMTTRDKIRAAVDLLAFLAVTLAVLFLLALSAPAPY